MTARKVVIPDVGEGGMDVVFVQWFVSEGDFVNEGDELFELDTAKANVSVQASARGFVVGLAASPDDEVERGQVVAQIADEREQNSEPAAAEAPATGAADEQTLAEDTAAATSAPTALPSPGRPSETPVSQASPASTPASPKAKHLARSLGVDLASVAGTGWVTADNVQAAHAAQASGVNAPDTRDHGDSRVIRAARQRVMATSAMASWLQSPHASISTSLERNPQLTAHSLVDLVTAVASALTMVDGINVRWDGQSAVERTSQTIGLLSKTDSGLILTQIEGNRSTHSAHAQAVEEASMRAKRGVLTPEDHDERSLTIMWIDTTSPMTGTSVLPHGDSAMVVAVSSDERLGLTLTVDHRCIDLATAARFLDTVASSLKEHP